MWQSWELSWGMPGDLPHWLNHVGWFSRYCDDSWNPSSDLAGSAATLSSAGVIGTEHNYRETASPGLGQSFFFKLTAR